MSSVVFSQSSNYSNYTIEDGLPSNHVYGCLQDKDGYMWFYTERGVAKFDGYDFKVFTIKDGLPTNDVWKLTEDSRGRIWVHSFSNTLVYIENDSIKTAIPKSESEFNQRYIFEDENQKIYFTKSGYYTFQEDEEGNFNRTKHFLHSDQIDKYKLKRDVTIRGYNDRLLSIIGDNIILETKDSVKKRTYKNLKLQKENYKVQMSSKEWTIIVDKTSNEILFIDVQDLELIRFNIDFLNLNEKTEMRFYLQGNHVFISTSNGLAIFDVSEKKIVNQFIDIDNINGVKVNRIYYRSHKLWISTTTKGVFLIDLNKVNLIKELSISEGLNTVYKFKDHLYLGSMKGKFFKYHITTKQLKLLFDKGREYIHEIRKNQNDKLKILWSGEIIPYNLYTQKSESWEEMFSVEFLRSYYFNQNKDVNLKFRNAIHDFFYINKDILYKTKFNTHLYIDSLKKIGVAKKAPFTCHHKMGENIILGYLDGLYNFKDHALEKIYSDYDISTTDVLDFKGQQLIVGTKKSGLFIGDPNFKNLYKIPGSEDIYIAKLLINGDNIFFISDGIYSVIQNEDFYQVDKLYDQRIHFQNASINDFVIIDSLFYVATDLGLYTAPLNKSNEKTYELPLIVDFEINGELKQGDYLDSLQYDQNNINISATAIQFNEQNEINYSYQLVNNDPERRTDKIRNYTYNKLKPGNYEFRISAKDIYGNQSEKKSFPIIIHPAIWQRPWFQMLCLSLLGYLIFLLTSRYNKRRSDIELERKNQEKQLAELQLKALRSQLNPHFIFNALGSIQQLIITNQNQNADIYLAKFSNLMRNFLNASNQQEIRLDTELEIIKAFVEMEQLRFEKKLNFHLEIEEGLDTDDWEIPSLVLQPLVENAISHGLFHKKEQGNLWIKISQLKEDTLKIEVIDDGIGIDKAKEIRKASMKNYNSVGRSIVKDGAEAFSAVFDCTIDIDTRAYQSEHTLYPGTHVTIFFKTNEQQ